MQGTVKLQQTPAAPIRIRAQKNALSVENKKISNVMLNIDSVFFTQISRIKAITEPEPLTEKLKNIALRVNNSSQTSGPQICAVFQCAFFFCFDNDN